MRKCIFYIGLIIFLFLTMYNICFGSTKAFVFASYSTLDYKGAIVKANPSPLTPNGGTWFPYADPSINLYYHKMVIGSGPFTTLDSPSYATNRWNSLVDFKAGGAEGGAYLEVLSDGYVPVSGAYEWITIGCYDNFCNKGNAKVFGHSSTFYLNMSLPISEQATANTIGFTRLYNTADVGKPQLKTFCIGLSNMDTGEIYGYGKPWSCSDGKPLGPSISCQINNGQALDVFLGNNIDRWQIGTEPGGYGMQHKYITIDCSGPTGSVLSASVALNFTPLSGSSDEVIATSTAGLGVITRLRNQVMANNVSTSIDLGIGSNVVNMDFTPVHLSSTQLDSIATGEFNSSASLILTWQ